MNIEPAAAAAGSMFIRPLMDNTALTGAETPPVIGQVVRDASREAQRAEKAGVTGSGEADLRADKIVKLFEGREVYARVLNDASVMVSEANRIAAENPQIDTPEGEPAFTLVTLDASFVSDDTAVTSAAAYDPGAYGEFGGEGGGYGRVSPTPTRQPQTKDDPLDKIKDKRRIRVQMELETGSENIYIMDDTIMAWLNDHVGPREGVPYSIFIGDQPWVQGASIAAATPQQGGTVRPTRGVRAPRGGPGQVFGGETGGETGGPIYNPRGGGGASGSTRAPELSQLAPIEPPQSQAPTGERQRYVVTWFAVLDPIEQTQEDDS